VFKRPPEGFPRRELLQFNTMSVLLVFLMMSLYHVDILMLQPLAGSEQVGYYKAALKLAEFLWFVPLAIQTVFVHSTSELWSRDRLDQITELATRTTRYTLLTTAVMALGIAALADAVVPIYFGPTATPAIEPLLLLLPGALGFAAARPLIATAQGKGDLKYPILATGSAALINAALNLSLIPTYGIRGAAVATSVGYGSMFVFHLWSARQIGVEPLADARTGRIALTTLLAAGPILYLPTVIPDPLLALVVVPPVGLTLFLSVAIATGALDAMEPIEVLGSFPSPIGAWADRVEGHLRSVQARWSGE
ncbi:MAG TPA: oligosaccharide flippase family protein, partial [Halobacteriales archaeon]|nr:oligosaccharide flippase family protein [Halobacteriales archaeon]